MLQKLFITLIICFSVLLPHASNAAEPAPETPFVVKSLEPVERNGYIYVSAYSSLNLPGEPQQALDSGLALYFQIDVSVVKKVKWWPDKSITKKEIQYRLRFYNLTRRYVVENANTGVTTAYRSLDEALRGIGELRDYPLIASETIEKSGTYIGQYQISLDISQLPTPLRPQAYVSNDWRIKSEKIRWRIK